MQIDIKRRTGFFGMASPVHLIQGGQRIASLSHQAIQTVEIDPSQPLTVKLLLLRSQPYMVNQSTAPQSLEILLNPLLKRFYLFSYGAFFVIAGFSAIFYANGWSWLLLIFLIFLYGSGLHYYIVRGFLIKEVE